MIDALFRPAHGPVLKKDPFAGAPSFPLRHRLLRLGFAIVWLVLARWTPPAWRRWRNLVLRLFGADLHPTANIYSSARVWYPPGLEMAAYASLGPGVICYNMARITLGERAVVSQRAHLCCGDHDIDGTEFALVRRPIHIGAQAWVAAEAFVGPGVTLGDGAVLGARAVAFRDLEPWTIHIGNPARLHRRRPRQPEPDGTP